MFMDVYGCFQAKAYLPDHFLKRGALLGDEDRFGRGFANFWDRILKFGTEVNFFKKINSTFMPG